MDEMLLQRLRCPETRQEVDLATPELVERLNEMIRAGELRNRAGELVGDTLDGGLVRADRKFLYPVRHEIPVMLIDESIAIESENKTETEGQNRA